MGKRVMLVDTVGFINKIPHSLMDAFKATLEEIHQADLLLVCDGPDESAGRTTVRHRRVRAR